MSLLKKMLIMMSCLSCVISVNVAVADESDQLAQWQAVKSVITARENQTSLKMKLSKEKVKLLNNYLNALQPNELVGLQALQKTLPKTTTELLFAIATRGIDKTEAEKIAAFMQKMPTQYHIQKVSDFDENTSHIIGREWNEIDYSGEGMTRQGQKEKYKPYGITNFKTLSNLEKFFQVESRLPYFYQVYGKTS